LLFKVIILKSHFLVINPNYFFKEKNFDLIKEVYEAVGEEYKEGKNISLKVLKDYIDHYITNLNSKSLSQLGNGVDAPDNTSRLDIYDDGNIKLQGKKDGKWIDITIRKEDDIPSNILDYMDNLITTIRFNNAKDKSLLGINSTDKVSIFGVKDNKFYSKKMTYNQYIMEGAKTYLEKGIESKNELIETFERLIIIYLYIIIIIILL
jgi:hypothetical protein